MHRSNSAFTAGTMCTLTYVCTYIYVHHGLSSKWTFGRFWPEQDCCRKGSPVGIHRRDYWLGRRLRGGAPLRLRTEAPDRMCPLPVPVCELLSRSLPSVSPACEMSRRAINQNQCQRKDCNICTHVCIFVYNINIDVIFKYIFATVFTYVCMYVYYICRRVVLWSRTVEGCRDVIICRL